MNNRILGHIFFLLIVRPFVWLILSLRVRDRQNLPTQGPAIICSNHNSHLDTVVLMALITPNKLGLVHPAAAADYWHANRFIKFFADYVIGVVPVYRHSDKDDGDPLRHCYEALAEGRILIYFPEGSRGKPEQIGRFKYGLNKLAQSRPDAPIIPVFMHGMGKAWPRGSNFILPFVCDVFIGRAITYDQSPRDLIPRFSAALSQLAAQGNFPEWQPLEEPSK